CQSIGGACHRSLFLAPSRWRDGKSSRAGEYSENGMNWSDTSILITGGTGSFGNKLTEVLMREFPPRRLIIFSRDELKQSEMRNRLKIISRLGGNSRIKT